MTNINDIFAKEFSKALKAMNTNLCSIAESMNAVKEFLKTVEEPVPLEGSLEDIKIDPNKKIMYLCDGRACPIDNSRCYDQCRYTFDVEHAKNFRKCKAGDNEWYAEMSDSDKQTLTNMFHNIIIQMSKDNELGEKEMEYVRTLVYSNMFPCMIKEDTDNEEETEEKTDAEESGRT